MHQTIGGVSVRRRILTTSAFVALLAVSCIGIGEPPTAPDYGFIRVAVTATGGDLDLDGYTLVIGQDRPILLTPSSSNLTNFVNSYYVVGGEYTVTLGGVAANCSVDGTAVRSVSVVRSQVTDVTFAVRCLATGIAITTHTTGVDTPDKLQLMVDQTAVTLAANGTQTIGRLAPGSHSLTLLTPNHCTITSGLAQSAVAVTVKTVVSMTYEIACTAIARLEKIAFVHDSTVNGVTVGWIELVNPDGTGVLPLAQGVAPEWSPARTRLGFSTTNCDDPYYYYYYYYYGPACSGGLVLADPELGDASLVLGGYPVFNPSWARNGAAIAFESFNEQQGDRVLKLLSVSSNAVVPIDVMGPRSKEQPSWSPDGTRIAFVCRWAVNTDICTVPAIGGIPVRMTDDAEVDLHPAWSPDGSRIAFARTPAGSTSPQIVLLDVATKQRTVLTGGTDPAWSPDGSKLVFAAADGLWVIDASGSNRRRLTVGLDHAPAWRP